MKAKPIEIGLLAWPASHLAEATATLGQHAGLLTSRAKSSPGPIHRPIGAEPEAAWTIEVTAAHLGLETEPIQTPYPEVDQMVRRAAPALLRLPGEARFLLLLQCNWRGVAVIGPDQTVHYLRPEAVRTALCQQVEAPLLAAIDQMLVETDVAPDRRPQVRLAILRQQLRSVQLEGCWLLRLSPGSSLWRQARRSRLWQPLVALFAAQLIQQIFLVTAWWIIGQGVLQGQLEWAWLLAGSLLLLTIIPFQTVENLAEGRFATQTAALFKQKLFYGILRLEPQETRHQGAGQFLGRVLEIEALELLALNGGLKTVTAGLSLIVAGVVLGLGAGGWLHVGLLCGWLIFTGALSWRYLQRRRHWDAIHRDMTNYLVEWMVGHRTRLAQEASAHWHDEEDQRLDSYLAETSRLDGSEAWLGNAISQGWLLLGLVGLAPAVWLETASITALAVSIGGVALAYQAFTYLVSGLASLVEAITAWEQTAPLFQAANRPEERSSPETGALQGIDLDQQRIIDARLTPLLEMDNLAFRHHQRELALDHCSLQIYAGDRLLLEGPSGGGKSTLATVLAGLRAPESGLLLWQGYDRQTLGRPAWQQQVVLAPQFHENHVITGTLAFNLLMGRRWPPRPDDLQEAETICGELGLGDLLARMPAGMVQMVGDGGWQLSHGERSRLYLARALLQPAQLIILDESLAALDPENLSLALTCIFKRAPTVMVIAHP